MRRTNLIRIFQNGKMINGTFKLLVILTVCFLLVSQSALAWSFWDWLGGKKQQLVVSNAKVQVQIPQQNTQPQQVPPIAAPNCNKQAEEAAYYKKLSDDFQRQSKAWQKEYELAMNYARGLERAASEEAKLSNRCNTYTYPQCPSNAVRLQLECSGSMLPSLSCRYDDIRGFNPNAYPYYKPKVCDIVSFDIPTPVIADVGGNKREVNRLIHRIIAVNGNRFITKGDSAEMVDAFLPSTEDVKYVYCR